MVCTSRPAWRLTCAAGLVGLALFLCCSLVAQRRPLAGHAQHLRSRALAEKAVLLENSSSTPPSDEEVAVGTSPASDHGAPGVLHSLAPTPWLLPRGTKLAYSGLENDLDALLRLQSTHTLTGYPAVTMIFFNYHHRTMLMNCIYSLIKFAGVSSYIVLSWDDKSLATCIEMNIPCYNSTALLPFQIGSSTEALFASKDYTRIMWFRPLVIATVLGKGYAVHHSDVDIAYAPSDLYSSFSTYVNAAGVDAAFQKEAPVNGGNYFTLPTQAGRRLFERWLSIMQPSIEKNWHDQDGLASLHGSAYKICHSADECTTVLAAMHNSSGPGQPKALIRCTQSAFESVFGNICSGGSPEHLSPVDPCAPEFRHAYFHPICNIGSHTKMAVLKAIRFWFIDDAACNEHSPLDSCTPLVWRVPDAEHALQRCPRNRLAFQYPRQWS